MIFFESTADPTMPWAGGEIIVGRGFSVGTVFSGPQTVDFWAKVNGCGQARSSELPDRVNDRTRVVLHDYGSCGVAFYEIQGGGHTWPGHPSEGYGLSGRPIGPVSYKIDATAVIIDFFKRYGL
jgi:polyhydroxybutyrate depolymerase